MFNFNKNKIRFIIYKKNRQVIQKKVEPKSNSFTYNGNSYIIDKENFYIWKNIATYSYREEVPIPLALKELQVIKGKEYIDFENVLMSSEELDTFKRSKTAKEILDTIDKKIPEGIFGLITIFIVIIGLGGVYYLLSQEIALIIQELQKITNSVGLQ
jgi:hypothetical protein